jgi:hypothetical protein
MNGIKEVIKSVGVLDSGSPDFREALYDLSTRLKSLQVSSDPKENDYIFNVFNWDFMISIILSNSVFS